MTRLGGARTRLVCTLGAAASLLSFAGAAGAGEPAAKPVAKSNIAVNVGTFKNRSGVLACRLYTSGAGFPMDAKGGVERRVRITGKVTRCTFSNVKPGTYAVAVVHDENDNGKLDTTFFGAPSEGYGVSNNHTYAFGAPKWEESKFTVQRGRSVGLGIALRY
jgi:uncharacterized protein (DUF2141 family)